MFNCYKANRFLFNKNKEPILKLLNFAKNEQKNIDDVIIVTFIALLNRYRMETLRKFISSKNLNRGKVRLSQNEKLENSSH